MSTFAAPDRMKYLFLGAPPLIGAVVYAVDPEWINKFLSTSDVSTAIINGQCDPDDYMMVKGRIATIDRDIEKWAARKALQPHNEYIQWQIDELQAERTEWEQKYGSCPKDGEH